MPSAPATIGVATPAFAGSSACLLPRAAIAAALPGSTDEGSAVIITCAAPCWALISGQGQQAALRLGLLLQGAQLQAREHALPHA